MQTFIFGHSSENIPILAHQFGTHSSPPILILGGVHGDEYEGVVAAQGLTSWFLKDFSYRFQTVVVPAFNIEGVIAKTRGNAQGIDLNRNLPTRDWTAKFENPRYNPGPQANSEPENKALVQWIQTHKPRFILSLHSWKPCLNINGNARAFAEVVQKYTGYEIVPDIGYPTPGALGTYSGLERDIPTLTYEIERGLGYKQILSIHIPAILEALKTLEQ